MPFIENKIGKKIKKNQVLDLKSGLGRILEEEIGKPERSLMVNISDENLMFLGGKSESIAYVEVKLLGELDIKQKDLLTLRIGKLYKEILDIDLNKIYITFFELELENWGFEGETFASKQ